MCGIFAGRSRAVEEAESFLFTCDYLRTSVMSSNQAVPVAVPPQWPSRQAMVICT